MSEVPVYGISFSSEHIPDGVRMNPTIGSLNLRLERIRKKSGPAET